MKKYLIILGSIYLAYCTSNTDYNEINSQKKSEQTANGDPIQPFEPGTSNSSLGVCTEPPPGSPPDSDSDGIKDPCDEFMVKDPSSNYMQENQGYSFGITSNYQPTDTQKTFTIENKLATTMNIAVSLSGQDASHFVFTPPASNTIASGSSTTFQVEINARESRVVTASVIININGTDYSMPVSGKALVCHGQTRYCNLRVNEFARPATHNSHANEADFYSHPAKNQKHSLLGQLNNGIRGMMLDTYWDANQVKLCHGACWLGWTNFSLKMYAVAGWLIQNPTETLIFVLEDSTSKSQLQAALQAGNVWPYVFDWSSTDFNGSPVSPGSTPWPKLGELIEKNKRLVILTSKTSTDGDWYLGEFQYGFENKYNDTSGDCSVDRGSNATANHIFIMNHFKTALLGGGDKGWADSNNVYSKLYPHASNCNNVLGKVPAMITVDWADTHYSDLRQVADQINANKLATIY